MSEQQEMFPDMPVDLPERRKRPFPRVPVWFYVKHAETRQMLSTDRESGKFCYIPFDLGSPRIMLFNSKSVARRYADKLGGVVEEYPYKTHHLYER